MTALTPILPNKLNEHFQQYVIDGSGVAPDSILDDGLNKHHGVLQLRTLKNLNTLFGESSEFKVVKINMERQNIVLLCRELKPSEDLVALQIAYEGGSKVEDAE